MMCIMMGETLFRLRDSGANRANDIRSIEDPRQSRLGSVICFGGVFSPAHSQLNSTEVTHRPCSVFVWKHVKDLIG
jgi:hypothetical protein